MGQKRNARRVLVRKPLGKESLNTEKDLKG